MGFPVSSVFSARLGLHKFVGFRRATAWRQLTRNFLQRLGWVVVGGGGGGGRESEREKESEREREKERERKKERARERDQ